MPRAKRLLTSLLALAGSAAFLAGSHWAGTRIARAGLISTTRHPSNAAAAHIPERTRPAPGEHAPHLSDVRKKLTSLVTASPVLFMDWETKAAVRKILAELTADELKDLHAGLHQPKDDFLILMTEAAWARLDPGAAFQAALARCEMQSTSRGLVRETTPVQKVFSEWAGNQPARALAWLESPDLLPEIAGMKDELYRAAIHDLVEKDFDLASRSTTRMSQENAGWLLQQWGQSYSGDPSMRDQLVTFARDSGRPLDYAALNQGLLKTWPQDDSVGMMNYLIGLKDYLESGAVPSEARAEVDAAAVGSAIGREYDRPALEWWMERYSNSSELPDALAAAFDQWRDKAPDKVDQWLAEQPPSPQLDALQGSLAPGSAARGNYQQAIEQFEKIADPVLRQQAAEGVNHFWSQRDPEAAAAWRATVPELFPEGAK